MQSFVSLRFEAIPVVIRADLIAAGDHVGLNDLM